MKNCGTVRVVSIVCILFLQTMQLARADSSETDGLTSKVPPVWWKEGVLADQLWKKQPMAALRQYKESVGEARAELAPPRNILALLNYQGDAEYWVRRLADARATFKEGAELARKSQFPGWQATFLQKQGNTERLMFIWGELSKVDPAPVLKALELEPGDPNTPTDFRAICYQCLGDIYRSNHDFVNCEKYTKLALAECNQMGDENYRIADLTCSLSLLRLQQGQMTEAIQLLKEACTSHPSYTDEYSSRFIRTAGKKENRTAEIVATANRLLAAHKYADLDKFADKLRASKQSSVRGYQLMYYFYAALGIDGKSEDEIKKRIAIVRDWITKAPGSPTPKILLARILVDYAWKARGSGLAGTVSRDGWRLMKARVSEAWALMQQVSNRPADWYTAAALVALGYQLPKYQYNVIVEESRKRFPYYDDILFSKAYFIQPKWYGEPGEAERFISSELKKRSGITADLFYARMIWYLDGLISDPTMQDDFDWPRMKRGLQELIKQYPNSSTAKAALVTYALRCNDKAVLQSFGVK